MSQLDSSEVTRLLPEPEIAMVSPRGYLLYGRQGTVFAQRFDLAGGTTLLLAQTSVSPLMSNSADDPSLSAEIENLFPYLTPHRWWNPN